MAEPQFRFRDDAPCSENIVSVEELAAGSNAVAVRIEPDEDARQVLPHIGRLCLIEVNFPAFGDGRGYSSARILREEGYTGELRAVGDVLIDQLSHMRRCGFDSFASDKPLDEAAAQRAFATWENVYQKTVDTREPIWAKRHA